MQDETLRKNRKSRAVHGMAPGYAYRTAAHASPASLPRRRCEQQPGAPGDGTRHREGLSL